MRTRIEIDEELLARATRALDQKTTRATVEEALRRAVQTGESDHAVRTAGQSAFISGLAEHLDLDVLAADEMWR